MTKLENYLDNLSEQTVQEDKQIVVVENPVIEELCEIYKQWLNNGKQILLGRTMGYGNEHKLCYDLVKNVSYSVEDVATFSVVLKKYEKHNLFSYSGLFLSALINNSEKNDFKVITEHLFDQINLIGFNNKKKLIVRGSVGNTSGWGMEEGELVITENAGNHVGIAMEAGRIIVEGNTGFSAGANMKGGKLIICNDTGDYVGLCSKSGEIHVEGKIESIAADCKAKVYQKGKQVWPE